MLMPMHSWVMVRVLISACWLAWFYPFVFRAPHWQRRHSITAARATHVGLLLEVTAIFAASIFQRDALPGPGLVAAAIGLTALCTILGWQAVHHLGRQFRVTAGLYDDHELVRSGPYALVRHPIYASLLGMLVVTFLLLTPWQIAPVCLAVFIAGTEFRVRAEDGLLASRFGNEFRAYQRRVRAYIPFVR
jgi:protein-S-isoprenylcysteine O-methyltransferase Ste14